MYDLTIATDTSTHATACTDIDDAHRALRSHIIAQDLYLRALPFAPTPATAFELISLDGNRPRIVGTATLAPTPEKPVIAPYYSAQAAMSWTADHNTTWRFAHDADPGVRYPLSVLTSAHAEAQRAVAAGTIYCEAASLSHAGPADVARPSQDTFDRLRDSAIDAGQENSITNAAELAAAVQTQLGQDISAAQTAALIWYYALILWGVTAS
ncbi:MAG: hypothetical protein M3Y90_07645 [Actinomycetota bacterium]|nr:hypothetical protein [Actinomycetota bacterium]